jgi:cell wall assembly regulator SMI1
VNATDLWTKYVAWLERNAPLAHANLAGPASAQEIAEVERVTGYALPEGVKDVWRLNNGQKETMIATTTNDAVVCIPTLSFLSTGLTVSIWRVWDQLRRTDAGIDELQSGGSSPEEGVVQPLYTHAGWIPLWSESDRRRLHRRGPRARRERAGRPDHQLRSRRGRAPVLRGALRRSAADPAR